MPMPMPGPPVVNNDFTFEAKAAPGETVVRVFADGARHAMGDEIGHASMDATSPMTDSRWHRARRSRASTSCSPTGSRQFPAPSPTSAAKSRQTSPCSSFRKTPNGGSRARGRLTSTAVARPDQNGRYSIRARLQPGDYYAVAVEYLDPNRRGGDRSYLEELSRQAVRFSIREEETKALDLKISTPR